MRVDTLYDENGNVGEGDSTRKVPFVPVLALTRKAGFEVISRSYRQDVGTVIVMRCPQPKRTWASDAAFALQPRRIVAPDTKRIGAVEIKARLYFDNPGVYDPTVVQPDDFTRVEIAITNHGKKPFFVSDECLFVDAEKGIRIVDSSNTYSDIPFDERRVMPHKTDSIGVGGEGRLPIKRIVYMDGWNRLEWKCVPDNAPLSAKTLLLQDKQADANNEIVFHEKGVPVRLHGIVPGVRLYADYVWPKAYVEASRDRMVLAREGRKQIVWNLNQLRGCVRVASKKDALRFVRLRTTPQTFYFFPPEEVEIMPRRDLARIPDYGVDSSWHFKPVPSGSLGVLSNREYRIGRFTPPRVHQIAEGFVINRWTYTNQEGICYVQEFVGRDGRYARRVLKKRQVKLRRMYWQLPEAAAEE